MQTAQLCHRYCVHLAGVTACRVPSRPEDLPECFFGLAGGDVSVGRAKSRSACGSEFESLKAGRLRTRRAQIFVRMRRWVGERFGQFAGQVGEATANLP